MKKIFTVYGSEDGIIGVYSTFKRAYARAKAYVEVEGEAVNTSYQKALKQPTSPITAGTSRAEAHIYQHWLNA